MKRWMKMTAAAALLIPLMQLTVVCDSPQLRYPSYGYYYDSFVVVEDYYYYDYYDPFWSYGGWFDWWW